jgi:transcriptional regulator with XRE-family HTH domain
MHIAEIIGKNLLTLRKEKNWTQDEVAEKLGVSAQAVSKWETGASCPDISLLPVISDLYGVLVDDLLRDEEERRKRKESVMTYVPEEKRKKPEELLFRVLVDSKDGDKVRINLPLPLLKAGIGFGMASKFTSKSLGEDALKDIDLEQIFRLAESGVIGKLIEVDSGAGDHVEIVVE